MKKVLIVGAGIGQFYLARKIKQRGDYLLTVTLPGKQPVIDIADKVLYHDVFDKEGVLKLAREENIDAIVSDQNDTMMPTVAYVVENMGLPGNNTNIINSYCNKNTFRDNCDKLGIPVPKHCAVTDTNFPTALKGTPFPWVVKPADSQSSVGVSKVNNEEEYYDAIKAALGFSKSHSAIVEEFFKGQELVAEGFIYNGKYYNLGYADRKYFDLEKMFIPSQTIFPSVAPSNILARIFDSERKMAEYIKPEFAIVHSEYLFDVNSGEIRVVESALRGGGVYISSHLVPLYSGIDINDVLLDCIVGKPVDMDAVMAQRNNKAAGYVCFYLPEGKVKSVSDFDELKSIPSIKMAQINEIKIGMDSPKLTHKGQRLGPVLVSANNRNELEGEITKLQSALRIEVLSPDGEIREINWK